MTVPGKMGWLVSGVVQTCIVLVDGVGSMESLY